ncbi:Retrovirus-related Pol polyprotein from transposon [Apostichopus japonicus]|uniref:Retrovirus-related Pol polyprotein from transposon n=1 Tax=Stichopus japonicus TaxID=307972 RepID=A0A2G8LJU0_STIJA|nr:Retrovirus-related Pol polyprotein from transposon [Apostichopus japonicus]
MAETTEPIEVRSFVGLCGYYRRFIRGFAQIALPLFKLTEKKQKFDWNQDCETAFSGLKTALTTAPVLSYPMSSGQDFILDTDASDFATGSVLSQIQDGNEKPIAYFSKTMSKQERRYCITRKELLAVVQSVKHFHHYLYGTRFLIRTDHAALKWLMSFKHPEGQTARWLEILGTYTFEISHRPGRFHGNADGLSRRPCSDDCQHCTRTETGDIDRDGPMEFKTHKWKRKENRST